MYMYVYIDTTMYIKRTCKSTYSRFWPTKQGATKNYFTSHNNCHVHVIFPITLHRPKSCNRYKMVKHCASANVFLSASVVALNLTVKYHEAKFILQGIIKLTRINFIDIIV